MGGQLEEDSEGGKERDSEAGQLMSTWKALAESADAWTALEATLSNRLTTIPLPSTLV